MHNLSPKRRRRAPPIPSCSTDARAVAKDAFELPADGRRGRQRAGNAAYADPLHRALLPAAILGLPTIEERLSLADTGTPTGLRDCALFELLYATSLRRMEVAVC